MKFFNIVIVFLLFFSFFNFESKASEEEAAKLRLLRLQALQTKVAIGCSVATALYYLLQAYRLPRTFNTNDALSSVNRIEARKYILSPETDVVRSKIFNQYFHNRNRSSSFFSWLKNKLLSSSKKEDEENIPLLRCLLHGPPGTGKTTFAERLAYELGIENVLKITTASITSSYIYGGAQRVKEIFASIRKIASKKPIVVIFDEVDAYFSDRTEMTGQHTSAVGGQLTEFLSQFDNAISKWSPTEKKNVVLIFTTNHLEKVDPGIRSRTKNDTYLISLPDFQSRLQLIYNNLGSVIGQPELEYNAQAEPFQRLARATAMFSLRTLQDFLSDIVNTMNQLKESNEAIDLIEIAFAHPSLAWVKKLRVIVDTLDQEDDETIYLEDYYIDDEFYPNPDDEIKFREKPLLLFGGNRTLTEKENIIRSIADAFDKRFISLKQFDFATFNFEEKSEETNLLEQFVATCDEPTIIFCDDVGDLNYKYSTKDIIMSFTRLLKDSNNENISFVLPCLEESEDLKFKGVVNLI